MTRKGLLFWNGLFWPAVVNNEWFWTFLYSYNVCLASFPGPHPASHHLQCGWSVIKQLSLSSPPGPYQQASWWLLLLLARWSVSTDLHCSQGTRYQRVVMWLSCDLSCDLHLTASLGDKALHKELWHFNQGKWVTLVQSQLYQTSHFSLAPPPFLSASQRHYKNMFYTVVSIQKEDFLTNQQCKWNIHIAQLYPCAHILPLSLLPTFFLLLPFLKVSRLLSHVLLSEWAISCPALSW